jgi:hypothetical protein
MCFSVMSRDEECGAVSVNSEDRLATSFGRLQSVRNTKQQIEMFGRAHLCIRRRSCKLQAQECLGGSVAVSTFQPHISR